MIPYIVIFKPYQKHFLNWENPFLNDKKQIFDEKLYRNTIAVCKRIFKLWVTRYKNQSFNHSLLFWRTSMWTKLQHLSREKSKNPQLLWRWHHHHRIKQMTLNMLSYLRENCSVFWLFWSECHGKFFLQRFLKGKYCCVGVF